MTSDSPQVRRRPPRARLADPHRNSNVVRASVLETALELGFGQNSTVADWIFNNPLSEEAEDSYLEPHDQVNLDTKSETPTYVAEAITPTLTSGSNSASDESSSLNSPANSAPNAAITTIQVHSHKPSVTESPHVHFGDFPSDQLQLFSPFTLSPRVSHLSGTRGISAAKPPSDAERSGSQDDSLECPSLADSGYTSEGQYLSKGKKDKPPKHKRTKPSKPKTPDSSTTAEKDNEYASDGGYLSASSNKSQGKSPGKVKARAMAFFRRRSKKSAHASDDEDEDNIPPVPAIPTLPRPSSPKLLERRAASPTRAGFAPLTLSLTSPPASPARRRVSKSPPPIVRATSPQQSDRSSVSQVASIPVPTISAPSSATVPLPSSMPGIPFSTASFPTTPSSTQIAVGPPKSLMTASSRQHLSIPPPAPPPTLPLPQPPSPSPTTPFRKGAPTRPVPVVPSITGSALPLTPRRAASPFRPLLPPRVLPPAIPQRAGDPPTISEGDQCSSKDSTGKQRYGTGTPPAFLQRKIQHAPPSPRYPPPDVPLPPSPCPTPSMRPRTPLGSSKFHEHLSSVSSTQVLSTPSPMSPSPSTAAFSECSSGFSVRSSHVSSASERSERPATYDSGNMLDYSRPTTSASTLSCSSYGHPIPSTFGRPAMDLRQFLDHRDSGSIATYDADDPDIEDIVPKSCADDDDDASVYTSDDKTAGRRTMYLVEHGESDENGDEIVIAGSHYWGGHELPPPVPPLPPMPIRPGPGYF